MGMTKINRKTHRVQVFSLAIGHLLAKSLSAKKALIFDLDGTLTASKSNLDKEMAELLCQLLRQKIVVVIGGGNYPQFKRQFLAYLRCPQRGVVKTGSYYPPSRLENLLIMPTSGGRAYKHARGKWRILYKNSLTDKEKKQIRDAFAKAFKDVRYIKPRKTYGKVLEDRESQITFSALGQKAPLPKKEEWNQKQDIRPQLKTALEKYLTGFEMRLGGLTSIDVTKKGIDKAYGIAQVQKLLSVPIKKMAYIGDALFEGGNDFAVLSTGIDAVQISGIEEAKYLIQRILAG
jgi:HAD superfamily hydrolase (TIGR01484 family)